MFRALLVGVPDYRDEAFPDLPFIDDDLVELSDALTECGYEIELHNRSQLDGDSIKHAIESFIVSACPGETLLVYLSGHGVHYRGMDYLIPLHRDDGQSATTCRTRSARNRIDAVRIARNAGRLWSPRLPPTARPRISTRCSTR